MLLSLESDPISRFRLRIYMNGEQQRLKLVLNCTVYTVYIVKVMKGFLLQAICLLIHESLLCF